MTATADSLLSAGTILIENRTSLPDPMRLEIDAKGRGWAQLTVRLDGHRFGKALVAAGWSCYFLAGAIQAKAIGRLSPGTAQKALGRLLEAVKLQECNCVEIDSIAAHSFWGVVPYVTITGHSRHIQHGVAGTGMQGGRV